MHCRKIPLADKTFYIRSRNSAELQDIKHITTNNHNSSHSQSPLEEALYKKKYNILLLLYNILL